MSTHEIRFVFQQDIREVLDHFSRLLRVRFCFLSPDGRELQVGENKPHCRFCQLIRHRLNRSADCLTCDRQGWQRAATSGRAAWYTCHAGMTDGCMAVRSDNRIIGYMMIGQFRSQQTPSPDIRRQWREQVGNADLESAFNDTPFYSHQQVRDIMGVFTVLVDFIVSQRLIAVRGLNPIQPLLSYLSEHPRETLSIADGARLLHRSASSFAHVFKETTGTSFLQYQIATKLDLADSLLCSQPHLTIREVAYEVGYSDPCYFSRLYRKHRGYPPSEAARGTAPGDAGPS